MTQATDETWYIAGPMSGLPQFNHPKFHEVAAILRQSGVTVINPAEEDSPEMQKMAMASVDGDHVPLTEALGETWGDILARDVRLIANKVTAIVMLPGWENSNGARLELFVAKLCGHRICTWYEEASMVLPAMPDEIRKGLEL